jgi:hypothetical protein
MAWRITFVVAGLILVLSTRGIGVAQNPTNAPDAVELYLQAARAIEIEFPDELRSLVAEVPPFSQQWHRVAQASWQRNTAARQLLRRATRANAARFRDADLSELGPACRKLTIVLTETAIYQHLQGDNAGAVDSINDGLTMSHRLRTDLHQGDLPRLLLSCAIEAATMEAFQIVISDIRLTHDADQSRDLHVDVARRFVRHLLEGLPVEQLLEDAYGAQGSALRGEPTVARVTEVLKRTDAARAMSAISLACHVYRFEKGRWPENLENLVPAFLPVVPLDPWGDGTQNYGYIVLKRALPDARDRPLVYARCESQDGLQYPTRRPVYDFYVGDALGEKSRNSSRAGQFRDITRWTPTPELEDLPTLKPLP